MTVGASKTLMLAKSQKRALDLQEDDAERQHGRQGADAATGDAVAQGEPSDVSEFKPAEMVVSADDG